MQLGPQFRQPELPGMPAPQERPAAVPRPEPAYVEGRRWQIGEKGLDNGGMPLSPYTQRQLHSSRETLQRAAIQGQPRINLHASRSRHTPGDPSPLESMVRDRRYKTQFETGTSGGSLAPHVRAATEKKMFDYATSHPEQQRPVYGHMSEDLTPGHQYGHTSLVLHPDVLKRTTLTHGDSLGAGVVPVSHADAAAGRIDPTIHGDTAHSPYVEAQFHGGVHLRDVAHAEFSEESSYRHDPTEAKTNLDIARIPWRMMRRETYKQHQLGHLEPGEGVTARHVVDAMKSGDKEGASHLAGEMAKQEDRPRWHEYGGEHDYDFGPVVSHQQFPVQVSKGFKSPWVGGGTQKGYLG
jgi:hypothetical protein